MKEGRNLLLQVTIQDEKVISITTYYVNVTEFGLVSVSGGARTIHVSSQRGIIMLDQFSQCLVQREQLATCKQFGSTELLGVLVCVREKISL